MAQWEGAQGGPGGQGAQQAGGMEGVPERQPGLKANLAGAQDAPGTGDALFLDVFEGVCSGD